MDIRKIATQSAYTYYEYAMCQEKGNIEYTVRRIIETDLFFELHLSSAIPSADNLKVKIHDSILEEEQVRIMEYNDEKRTVLLLPSPEYRRILQTCSIFDIVLVANVRFLIKRIEDWYNQYGHQLALPTKKPSVLPYEPRQIQETPSQDQMAAIQGVFKSPLSYIWGAPGTGKTQYVLARCLLAYIKRGKKVLITAPTNHALEQILYGVLPILESVDIPTEKVLRLGIPTAEFMQKHPHVCENHHLQLKLFQIQEQIKTAKIRLEQLQKQVTKQNRHQNYITARKDFEEFVNCANAPLDQLSQLFKEYKKHEENIRFYNVKQNHYRQELINADRKIEQTKKDLFILDKKLTKFKKGLLAYFFQTKIEKLQNNHKLTLSALNAFEKEKNKLEEKQLQNKTQTDFEVKEQQENSKQQESIIDNLQASADILLNLHLLKTISFPQNKDIYSAFCNAIQKGVELFEEKEREYADMPPYNAQETISEMHSATKQLEQLEQELNQFSYIQN